MEAATLRVLEALRGWGLHPEVKTFAESTRTAREAAAALAVDVDQIAKSLIFAAGDRPILCLVAGGNRVNEARLGEQAGAPVTRLDASAVRRVTGFAIGGIPPIGFAQPISAWMDRRLFDFPAVWAAAGTPHAVFRIAPEDLRRVAKAEVVSFS